MLERLQLLSTRFCRRSFRHLEIWRSKLMQLGLQSIDAWKRAAENGGEGGGFMKGRHTLIFGSCKDLSFYFKLKRTFSTSDARKGTQFVDQSLQEFIPERMLKGIEALPILKKKVGVSDISDTSRVAQNTSKSHTSLKPFYWCTPKSFAHKTPPPPPRQLCENTPCCKVALWVLKGFTNSCQPRVAFFQSTHTSKHHTSGTKNNTQVPYTPGKPTKIAI